MKTTITWQTVHDLSEESGIPEQEIREMYHQDGVEIKLIYTAERSIHGEIEISAFAGVTYTDGTHWVYGLRQDMGVRNKSSMIEMLLAGF